MLDRNPPHPAIANVPPQIQPVVRRLVADVGGTNTRVGLVGADGRIEHLARLRNDDYPDLATTLNAWRAGLPAGLQPVDAAIAVAAPVRGAVVRLTNRPDWCFTRPELAAALAVDRVHVINDFTAVALSLPWQADEHVVPIRGPGDGAAAPAPAADPAAAAGRVRGAGGARAPMVVMGPGTGLGVSALIPCGGGYCAIEGEGGHATLAALDAFEAAVVEHARRRAGHVCYETLLCGTGLPRLYAAVGAALGAAPPVAPVANAAAVVTLAEQGEAVAERTLECFFEMLGSLAGDLALAFGAYGGVYLAGGILPRLTTRLLASRFRERFLAKGDYAALLATVPTALITEPEPALTGLASFVPQMLAGDPVD